MEKQISKRTFWTFLKEDWWLAAIILYIVSPIDVIPDSIPLIGNLDDGTLLIIEFLRNYVQYKKQKPAKD